MNIALGGLRGRLVIFCAALAGTMLVPAAAHATLVTFDGLTLNISEDVPGNGVSQVNDITVTSEDGINDSINYVVHDARATVIAGPGCLEDDSHTAICPDVDGSEQAESANVDVGEEGDFVRLDQPSLNGFLSSSTVNGGTGADQLRGLLLAPDTLNGQDDGDSLSGFGGNDTLSGGQGVDTFRGGDGDDTLRGGAGGDDFRGEGGTDTVDYSTDGTSGVHARINGTPSSGANCEDPNAAACEKDIIRLDDVENLIGTSGNDFLYGSDVRNVLDARQGNDQLYGYDGNDQLEGDEGDDLLQGGFGSDTIDGGAGTGDTVDYTDRAATADASDDVVVDLSKTDASNGGSPDGSADTITNTENANGGEGDDILIGKSDSVRNVLKGNGGNDFLRGKDGPDTLTGGTGTDTVSYQDDDDDTQDANGVTVTPGVVSGNDGGDSDGAAGSRDTVDGDVENLVGGPDNDQLFGTADVNVLSGAGGSDLLTGFAAADHFYGYLPPGWPTNQPVGTEGTNDRVSYSERAASVTADLDADTDDGNADDGVAGQRDYIEGATIEGLIGGSGADDLTGNTANNSLAGNGGDDFLRGGLGADTFSGGPNEDTVDYSNDAGRAAGVVVSIGNAGSGDGQTGEGDSVPADVENVVGTPFKDELTGEIAANKLFGLGGDDTLDGDAGNDLLDGGDGAGDRLFGGPDNDTMHGGSTPAGSTPAGGSDAADVIDGGAGVNTVTYSRLDKVPGVSLAAKLVPFASPDRTEGVNVTLDNAANDGLAGELDHVLLVSNVIGAQGNDTLTGNTAANTLNGMDGDDTLNPGAEGGTPVSDVLIGGNGERDRADYSGRGTDDLDISLDGVANDGKVVEGEQVENDHIHDDVEDVTTADGQDKVTGETDNDNRINVAGGNDTVFTRDSTGDTIDCGAGTDTLTADRRDAYSNCETVELPAQPLVKVSGPQAPVGENEANATFTISIDDVIGQPVTVQYSTSDGTATAGQDYESRLNQTATIPAGASQVQVTVPIKQDTLDENNETFNLRISSPSNATLAPGGDTASATIADDDAQPTVSVTAESVEESDTGTKTHAVDVTLSAVSSKDVTVKYSTADGTATAGEDYTAVTEGTVTIPAGQTTGHANVDIIGDARDEDNEKFTVTLSDPTNATLGTATAEQTITDNDNPPEISIGDASVGEGDTGETDLVLPVTLSAPSNKTVTVHYEIEPGTAEAGDFTDANGDVTFQPGDTGESITVKVNGDTTPEPDEAVTVTLSDAQNASIADGTATGTILDDDTPGLSVGDVTVAEGDEGTKNATFTVTLDPASDEEVTVKYATAAGTATQPADFTERTGTLTFAPGDTSKQVSVPVNADTVDEDDETFTLQLSEPANAEVSDGSGLGTITDDDAAPSLSVTGGEVTEGNEGTKDLVFTVTQSAASEREVTVEYATADGTAKAGEDYTATSGTLTIEAGETSAEVKVPVSGDTAVEEDEAFTLALTEPSNATVAEGKDKATGTIKNDDEKAPDVVQPVAPALSVSDVKVAEGDAGTAPAIFTVVLSEPTSATVTAKFATSNGTATAGQDYQAAAGTITFAPGERTKTIPVNVIGDRRDEADETFVLSLSEPAGATLQKASGTALITDDETPRVAPRGVNARTTPSRDRRLPYRFRTKGRVTLPSGVRRSDACAGKVQVRIKAGRKTISTRRAKLRRDCTFSRRVSFGIRSRVKPGRLKVQVRFLGNAVLLPKSARTRFVRAG